MGTTSGHDGGGTSAKFVHREPELDKTGTLEAIVKSPDENALVFAKLHSLGKKGLLGKAVVFEDGKMRYAGVINIVNISDTCVNLGYQAGYLAPTQPMVWGVVVIRASEASGIRYHIKVGEK